MSASRIAALLSTALMPLAAAQASTVTTWVQYAPGSTQAALSAGKWGDNPLSTTNTILVRAVVTDATACPAGTFEDGSTLQLNQRFIGSQVENVPGTPGATNAANTTPGDPNYPQYFVSATPPAYVVNGMLPDGTPAANPSWGECEAVVAHPSSHTHITVSGVKLKLPVAKPKRILVMADTGCRLNGKLSFQGANEQDCHTAAFPLQYLSPYEASFNPDAVIQVGDWFYRDTDCTGGTSNVADGGEPFSGCNTYTSANYEVWGDQFDSWNADVFFPFKALLQAAPVVMARGNHESCGRGARGWFATLDPYPLTSTFGFPGTGYNNTYSTTIGYIGCAKTSTYPSAGATTATYSGDFEPSYPVPLGGVNFIIQDSSFANDSKVDKPTAHNYDIDLSNLLATLSAATPAVYTSHKPIIGLSYTATDSSLPVSGSCAAGGSTAPGAPDNSGDWTEQSMFNGGTGYAGTQFANGVPSFVGLFLSGHVHQFQYLNTGTGNGQTLNGALPPQLVIGTGGSLLDADCNTGLVPSGLTDPAAFSQAGVAYELETYSGMPTYTTVTANTFSHDEFGFAVFDAKTDSNGNTTGYRAEIYKISSARAGVCNIVFANPAKGIARSVTCHV